MDTEGKRVPVAVGIGELLWDVFPHRKELGGAPANFVYHFQALGGKGLVVSAVGKDQLGEDLLDHLKQKNVPTKHIALDSEHPTSTVTVNLDSAGVPSYYIRTGVAWDFIPHAQAKAAMEEGLVAVCFGTLAQRSTASKEAIRRFLISLPRGCLKVFDINLRAPHYDEAVVRQGLEFCDVLKLNDEELGIISKMLSMDGTEQSRLEYLMERYSIKVAALTRGAGGSLICSGGDCEEHNGFPVEKVISTVGAGDAFSAALTMGLIRGLGLEAISVSANNLASYVCSERAAMPVIPARFL